MYGFLLRPRWLVGHALVLAVALLFVNLGLWQLDRHRQRQAYNERVEQGLRDAPRPLSEVTAGGAWSRAAYRRVSLTGAYASEEELLVTPRAYQGRPGYHVLTPLRTDDGHTLLVDRGWVPYDLDRPPVAGASPPQGRVEVTGLLVPGEPAARAGAAADGGTSVRVVTAVDLDRLQRQISGRLYPMYLQLETQDPPQEPDLPLKPPPPELSAGAHLSYAGQWFLFAAIGLVGYPLLIRRTAREATAGR